VPSTRGRCHSHRPLRQLQCRTHQERLSHGAFPPLRPSHADDLGHSLQLFAAGATVERRILRAHPQFQKALLAAAVPLRRVARRSPSVRSPFAAAREHDLERLSNDTLYLPYATSLRMGRLGYQSDAQSSLAVSYNSLDSYGVSLQDAMTKPYPAYEAIGLRDG